MVQAENEEIPVVTKKDIVKRISEQTGLPQLKVKEVVQRTFEEIINTLVEEGRIELRNFGVFKVKARKARKARNPKTGNKVPVPAKYVVTFKPGKEMEQRVLELGEPPSEGMGGPSPVSPASAAPTSTSPLASPTPSAGGVGEPGETSPAVPPGPQNPSS